MWSLQNCIVSSLDSEAVVMAIYDRLMKWVLCLIEGVTNGDRLQNNDIVYKLKMKGILQYAEAVCTYRHIRCRRCLTMDYLTSSRATLVDSTWIESSIVAAEMEEVHVVLSCIWTTGSRTWYSTLSCSKGTVWCVSFCVVNCCHALIIFHMRLDGLMTNVVYVRHGWYHFPTNHCRIFRSETHCLDSC